MGRIGTLLLLLIAAYVGSYAVFRQSHREMWAKDGQNYVLFPADTAGLALYYAWRPLSYADSALTGTRSHIGPHR